VVKAQLLQVLERGGEVGGDGPGRAVVYRPRFLAGCAAGGIPARELTAAEALSVEPGLNPALKAAVWVPDATMDAMRLPLRFFATAGRNGAQLRPFTEVTGLLTTGRAVTG
jgi:glycerol-3-phosphate dehydrogenase